MNIPRTLDDMLNKPNVIGYVCTTNFNKTLVELKTYLSGNEGVRYWCLDYDIKMDVKRNTAKIYIDGDLRMIIKPSKTLPKNRRSIW